MSTSPLVPRLQLGRELRRLREAAALSRDDAATELECTVSKISKIETGKAAMRPAEVRALLDLYHVTERGMVLQLARDARRRSTVRMPDWATMFVALEADAAELRTYHTELVPGLLQTEDYARVVTQAADPTRGPREVDRLVAARIERQQRLRCPGGPLIWAILNEAVIRRQVGDKETIGRQLEHLAEANTDSNITIQVLPFAAGAHPAMGSSFVHLRRADPADGEIVYLENMASADYLTNPAKTASYLAAFDLLAQAALDPAQSSVFMKSAA